MKPIFASLLNFMRTKRLHIFIWIIFIFYEAIIVGLIRGTFATFYNYLIHYAINISIFYIHACWVLPWAFKDAKSTVWKVPLYIMIELLVFVVAVYYVDLFLIKHTDIMQTNVIESHIKIILGITWRSLYFMMFGTGFYFLNAYIFERKVKHAIEKTHFLNVLEQERIKKDLEIAKNAYLKAQINPHFLFNTLDFIYHDVIQHSPKSADAVLGLVEIMRFSLNVDYYGEYIEVGDEIEQLQNLISLHQIRQNGKVLIELRYTDEVKGLDIIPLVLLTLAENMFKHGNLIQQAGQMEIIKMENLLYITTNNAIDIGKRRDGFGSGLSNIKQRLQSVYKGKAELNYTSDDINFKVELLIPVSA